MAEVTSFPDIMMPLFRKYLAYGKEQELENFIGLGLPVEAYFIFFQEATDWLLEQKYINNLRYLELLHFLNEKKNSIQDLAFLKERVKELTHSTKPIFFINGMPHVKLV